MAKTPQIAPVSAPTRHNSFDSAAPTTAPAAAHAALSRTDASASPRADTSFAHPALLPCSPSQASTRAIGSRRATEARETPSSILRVASAAKRTRRSSSPSAALASSAPAARRNALRLAASRTLSRHDVPRHAPAMPAETAAIAASAPSAAAITPPPRPACAARRARPPPACPRPAQARPNPSRSRRTARGNPRSPTRTLR